MFMFVMKNSAGKVGNYSCTLLDFQQTVAHLNEIQPLSSILNTHCVKIIISIIYKVVSYLCYIEQL
jgi:hypothetical protein